MAAADGFLNVGEVTRRAIRLVTVRRNQKSKRS
jgi:hypothetical protein